MGVSDEYRMTCSMSAQEPSGAVSSMRQRFSPGMSHAAYLHWVMKGQIARALAWMRIAASTVPREALPVTTA